MRYYEVKEPIKSGNFEFDYIEAIKNIICTNIAISPEIFIRLTKLFSRAADLKVGDVLEIEDQDFSVLVQKLNAWVGNFTGAALQYPALAEFIESFQKMPNKKVEKQDQAPIISE